MKSHVDASLSKSYLVLLETVKGLALWCSELKLPLTMQTSHTGAGI